MINSKKNGPWFINGYYLFVKRWQPNFVAAEANTHIFIKCTKAIQCWGKLGLLEWLQHILDGRETNWLTNIRDIKNFNIHNNIEGKYTFPLYVWSIWLNRNHNYHNEKKDDILTSTPLDKAVEFYYLGIKENKKQC